MLHVLVQGNDNAGVEEVVFEDVKGLVSYSVQEVLNVSVSPEAIGHYFDSYTYQRLILPGNIEGYEYFLDLLRILGNLKFVNHGSEQYELPEDCFRYIDANLPKLSLFECRQLLHSIDTCLKDIIFSCYQLYSAYTYLRNKIYDRYQDLGGVKAESHTQVESGEIINLGELLASPDKRGRFIALENENPTFAQKINRYRKAVQANILTFGSEDFEKAHDEIYRLWQMIIFRRNDLEYDREKIETLVSKLTVFEVRYLLDCVNTAIYPESQTSLVERMKYMKEVRDVLERRIGLIDIY